MPREEVYRLGPDPCESADGAALLGCHDTRLAKKINIQFARVHLARSLEATNSPTGSGVPQAGQSHSDAAAAAAGYVRRRGTQRDCEQGHHLRCEELAERVCHSGRWRPRRHATGAMPALRAGQKLMA
jgi:hypothetical protein